MAASTDEGKASSWFETISPVRRCRGGNWGAAREARQGVGFTLEQAAQEMETSKTSVIRIEKGRNEKVRVRDVEGFGRLYELPERRIDELKALAQQSATKSWWAGTHLMKAGFGAYPELEAAASELHLYQSSIVPGLLQSLDYARYVVRPFFPTLQKMSSSGSLCGSVGLQF